MAQINEKLKKLLANVDAHIVQSGKVERELNSLLPNPIYDKVFHPIYDNLIVLQYLFKLQSI